MEVYDTPATGEGYTTTVKDINEKQRKRISAETWWNYNPVNTTEFGVENIIKFQIPSTDVIFDMSRAFITLDYSIPVNILNAYADLYVNGRANQIDIDAQRTAVGGEHINLQNCTLTTLCPEPGESEFINFNPFMGMFNAASIFSLSEMYMDGNLIWHNDYTQAQSRLWSLNKNDQWVDSQYQTFFRPSACKTIQDICDNTCNFAVIELDPNKRLPDGINNGLIDLRQKYYVTKQLKIPLVMLYPQFEVMNGWPSFLVKQILYLQLTVGQAKKYMINYLASRFSVLSGLTEIADYTNAEAQCSVCNLGDRTVKSNILNTSLTDGRDTRPVYRYFGQPFHKNGNPLTPKAITEAVDLAFDFMQIQLSNVTLYLPSHIPEFKEREEYTTLVNNGLTYGFKYYNILSQTTSLATSNQNTMSLTFNSAVNNLEAINLLFMDENTEVNYIKPSISAIQANLGNSWQLSASGTHVENLFTRDQDFLQDLLKGWGQSDKKYMQTVSSDIINDFRLNNINNYDNNTATHLPATMHYMADNIAQIADIKLHAVISRNRADDTANILLAALPNKEGFYGFACNIATTTYERDGSIRDQPQAGTVIQTYYEYPAPQYGAYTLYFDVSPGDELGVSSGQYSRQINFKWTNQDLPGTPANPDHKNFLNNAKIYLCQQTFNTISITPAGVYIKNPFAEEFDIKKTVLEYRNQNYDESGLRTHGFASPHGLMAPHGFAAPHGFISGLTSIVRTIKPIVRIIKPYVKPAISTGKEIWRKIQEERNKQHGGMNFKVKAMKKLGKDGYYKHISKIEKYATRPYAQKTVLHGLIKEHFKPSWSGIGQPPWRKKKSGYIPGTNLKRFRFDSIPQFSPGWRSGANKRPARLMPFGRGLTSIPLDTGSTTHKHGLCPPYHGLLPAIRKTIREYWRNKVPRGVSNSIKPFRGPLQRFLDDKRKNPPPRMALGSKRHGMDKRLDKIYKYGERLPGTNKPDRISPWSLYNKPKHFMSKYSARFNTGAALRGAPHGKHAAKYFKKYYAQKYGNTALKLERQMWKLGKKRVNDGQY